MELMQSDVFVKSAARRLFALLTAVVAFATPRHVPIALRTLDALLIRPQPVEPAQCRAWQNSASYQAGFHRKSWRAADNCRRRGASSLAFSEFRTVASNRNWP